MEKNLTKVFNCMMHLRCPIVRQIMDTEPTPHIIVKLNKIPKIVMEIIPNRASYPVVPLDQRGWGRGEVPIP